MRHRFATYSASNPLDVPNVVPALLPFFDAVPQRKRSAIIAERTGVTLEIDLVRKLADFNVLKPVAS